MATKKQAPPKPSRRAAAVTYEAAWIAAMSAAGAVGGLYHPPTDVKTPSPS